MSRTRCISAAATRALALGTWTMAALFASMALLTLPGCSDEDETPCNQVLYSATDQYMNATCRFMPLPSPIVIEAATAEFEALTTAISDAHVYFHDTAGDILGEVNAYPENHAIIVQTATFDPPIEVAELELCSWWNATMLLRLELVGDPPGCTP